MKSLEEIRKIIKEKKSFLKIEYNANNRVICGSFAQRDNYDMK